MHRWLIVAVLVAPLALVPASWGTVAEGKTFAFLLLGGMLVIALVQNLWVRLFAGWTVLAYLLAGAHGWALSAVGGVLAWALFYQQASGLTESAWGKVRLAVLASALVQVGWLGLQMADRDPIFNAAVTQGLIQPPAMPVVGWMGNPMDLALYLGLSLPLLAAVRPAWVGLTAAGVTAGAILLVLHATVGTMAVGVTAVWLGWSWLPSWWLRVGLVLAVGLLGGAYVVMADPHVGSRPLIWQQTLQLIGLRPFVGWGPNALDHRVILLSPVMEVRWNFVFNEWLQGWLELGLVAPALAAGYLVTLVRRLRGRVSAAAELAPVLVILLAASLFSIPFRVGPAALLAALCLGQMERRLA